MSATKIPRNKALVWLRKIDRNYFSYSVLGEIFGMDRTRAEKVYSRDHKKYPLPPKIDVASEPK